jgi:twitching motility protein PilT
MATPPELLKTMVEQDGSDLHIATNTPPQIRVHGHLHRLDLPDLQPADTKQLVYSVLTDAQKKRSRRRGARLLVRHSSLADSVATSSTSAARWRRYRLIPEKIVRSRPRLPQCLALVRSPPRPRPYGPTGSGKSTTLAAMLDKINTERHDHILTIEDPIEYIHSHKNCLVNQREVHSDTNSFSNALRAALREDPDIVLIGEMRDLETVEAALKIAETGHLTFGTLHTNRRADHQSNHRHFPANQQVQIRTQLSLVLKASLSGAAAVSDGKGRVVSLEIMVPTPAIRKPDPRRQDSPDLRRDDRAGEARDANAEPVARELQRAAHLTDRRWASCRIAMNCRTINRGVGVVAGAGMGRPGGMPARPTATVKS